MFKKLIAVSLIVLLFTVTLTSYAASDFKGFRTVNVRINGSPLNMETPAINFYGYTMLPIRKVAEALGSEIIWDGSTNTVNINKADTDQIKSAVIFTGKAILYLDAAISADEYYSKANYELSMASELKKTDSYHIGMAQSYHDSMLLEIGKLDTLYKDMTNASKGLDFPNTIGNYHNRLYAMSVLTRSRITNVQTGDFSRLTIDDMQKINNEFGSFDAYILRRDIVKSMADIGN